MSYAVDIYSKEGKKVDSVKLDATIFSKDVINTSLMYDYIRMQRNNARIVIASTKTRAEVAGSGKKMYSQKGHGTGRVGEKRSPLRKKGGVAFGPKSIEVYKIKMNQKAKSKAMLSLIVSKLESNVVKGIDDFGINVPSTKNANIIMKKIIETGSTLVVLDTHNPVLIKSLRNIPKVEYALLDTMDPMSIMRNKTILFTKEALSRLSQKYSV